MGLSNGCQLLQRHICDSLAHEDFSCRDQVQGLFKGHFNIVLRPDILPFSFFSHIEHDIVFELAPFLVFRLHGHIVEAKVLDNYVSHFLGICLLQSHVEESRLLGQEPLSKLVITAVG